MIVMPIDDPDRSHPQSALFGTLCAAAGVVAVALSVFVGVTSFTAYDPPGWVRIAGLLLLLGSLVAAAVLGVFGLRGEGRGRAVVGLVLGVVALSACVVMIMVGG
jgi:hypothetical protein